MAESDSRPLADVLFGSPPLETTDPNEELAEVISAWFRAVRARLHDGASFGTPSAEGLTAPPGRS
jgi:hypothetical protein